MDNYEAVYSLYKDKAINVLKAANNFFIFLIITTLSVFVPLAYTQSDISHDFLSIIEEYGFVLSWFFVPVFIFMFAKYREYKYKYSVSLIKSIVDENFIDSDNDKEKVSYEEVCKYIENITLFEYKYIMNILIKIYPPKKV